HTLVGTNPATLLTMNVTSVLSVGDASQPIFYSEFQDWVTTYPGDGSAQVSRTTNSTIPDGEAVLITYSVIVAQSETGLTLTIAGGAEIAPGGALNANSKGYGGNVGTGNGGEAGSPQSGGGAGH